MEDHDLPDFRIAEVVADPVHEDSLADVERRLHRRAGDAIGLHEEGLDSQREAEGDGHDHDELDQ